MIKKRCMCQCQMAACALGDGLDTDSFRSKQLGYFYVRSHGSLCVVFTQPQKAPKDCGFCNKPCCCSLESLYSVCVCVHIVQCCQVCSLYRKLVQTEIRPNAVLAYRGACSTTPDLVSARNCKQKPANVCCEVFCIRLFKYTTLFF